MKDDTRGPGDNLPPADANPLRDRLADQYEELTTRRDDLLAGIAETPGSVDDEDTARKVTDWIKQIAACIKNANSIRVSEKEPYLEGGRQVDGYFKTITEPLDKGKKKIEGRLTLYQRQVAAEEKRRRDEERRDAEEAAALAVEVAARAAEALRMERDLDAAVQAEAAAEQAAADAVKAQVAADAKAADMSRTRGDYGGVSSLRTRWVGILTTRAGLDLESLRDHIPEAALEQAIRSFVKAGGRKLSGAQIYEDTMTVVR